MATEPRPFGPAEPWTYCLLMPAGTMTFYARDRDQAFEDRLRDTGHTLEIYYKGRRFMPERSKAHALAVRDLQGIDEATLRDTVLRVVETTPSIDFKQRMVLLAFFSKLVDMVLAAR